MQRACVISDSTVTFRLHLRLSQSNGRILRSGPRRAMSRLGRSHKPESRFCRYGASGITLFPPTFPHAKHLHSCNNNSCSATCSLTSVISAPRRPLQLTNIKTSFGLIHGCICRYIKWLTSIKLLSSEMRRKSRLWSSRADPIPDLRQLYLQESLRGSNRRRWCSDEII